VAWVKIHSNGIGVRERKNAVEDDINFKHLKTDALNKGLCPQCSNLWII
jgi:hypothetical protein